MKKARPHAAPALVGVIAGVIALGAGPALGAQINKCTKITKPGSYVVTRNLTAVGDCLVVTAAPVTIDLGGWAITGDGLTGNGVAAPGGHPINGTVRNGTVTGFALCVAAGVVEKVLASCDVDGIAGSIVRDNIASGLIGAGIRAGRSSIVSGNDAGSNSGVGIRAGDNSIISDNIAAGDLGIGAGSQSRVSGNNVFASDGSIHVGPGSTVSGNTAHFDEAPGTDYQSDVSLQRHREHGDGGSGSGWRWLYQHRQLGDPLPPLVWAALRPRPHPTIAAGGKWRRDSAVMRRSLYYWNAYCAGQIDNHSAGA